MRYRLVRLVERLLEAPFYHPEEGYRLEVVIIGTREELEKKIKELFT